MPTPSEQKALAFLAFVILLGGTVRVLRAGAPPAPTAEEQQALARQTAAAESAGARARVKKGARGRVRVRPGSDSAAIPRDPWAGLPVSDPRRDRYPGAVPPGKPASGWVNGYPPPSPRVDIDNRQLPLTPGIPAVVPRGREAARDTLPIDLDVATEAEIEALPRVGPATAARIVANRDSFGPFSSLEGLRRVRGMGPATLQRLAPRVTFSGRAASFTAGNRSH